MTFACTWRDGWFPFRALYDGLKANGMLQPGENRNFQVINHYFTERLAALPGELEEYRQGRGPCELPYVDLNGNCAPHDQCYCLPPKGGELLGAGGVPAVDAPVLASAPKGGDIAIDGGPIIRANIKNYAVVP
jgi:hypothetical protein